MVVEADGPRKRQAAGIEPLEAAKSARTCAEGDGQIEDQNPPLPRADGGKKDRISHLDDGVLGSIISLLPTKEAARAQLLASRWRNVWRYAPLNLDYRGLCEDQADLDPAFMRILSAHPGPARRLCAPVDQATDAWFGSAALNNLQELELCSVAHYIALLAQPPKPLPATAFRFSETLSVAVFVHCQLPDISAQPRPFLKLKKLVLEYVRVSDCSLNALIDSCCVLECLLMGKSFGFSCLTINSTRLKTICCQGFHHDQGLQLIVKDAPCLQRLLLFGSNHFDISVISAPKLETLGYLSYKHSTRITFGSTVIEGLRVANLGSELRTVKNLAIEMRALSLDNVILLMRCFPCLEKLYIESTGTGGETNLWRHKHQAFLGSRDIHMKRITWWYYRGIKSHVNFVTFFLQNARALELMTLQVEKKHYNEQFFAKQQDKGMLELDRKASADARLQIVSDSLHRHNRYFSIHDLDRPDPFLWVVPSRFHVLS